MGGTRKAVPAYTPLHLYDIPRVFSADIGHQVQARSRLRCGFRDDKEPLQATSGLIVTCWLLDVVGVERITLAGFDHFAKDKQHHYWVPKAAGNRMHDGDTEALMFAELAAAGRVKYL